MESITDKLPHEILKMLSDCTNKTPYAFMLKQTCTTFAEEAPKQTRTSMDTVVESMALLQWARKQGCPWDARTCSAAAAGGHLACLQYLHEEGCEWNVST